MCSRLEVIARWSVNELLEERERLAHEIALEVNAVLTPTGASALLTAPPKGKDRQQATEGLSGGTSWRATSAPWGCRTAPTPRPHPGRSAPVAHVQRGGSALQRSHDARAAA